MIIDRKVLCSTNKLYIVNVKYSALQKCKITEQTAINSTKKNKNNNNKILLAKILTNTNNQMPHIDSNAFQDDYVSVLNTSDKWADAKRCTSSVALYKIQMEIVVFVVSKT